MAVSIVFVEKVALFLVIDERLAVTPWRIDGYGEPSGGGQELEFFGWTKLNRRLVVG